jgi:hypothetical protein
MTQIAIVIFLIDLNDPRFEKKIKKPIKELHVIIGPTPFIGPVINLGFNKEIKKIYC